MGTSCETLTFNGWLFAWRFAFNEAKKKMSFITIIIIMCSSQTNVQFPTFREVKFNYFPSKKTNGDFSGVSRVLYRWTWAVMFQSPVLNSAAKVALIRLFASWQHLSALEEGCQTALEHFQSSLSQQMELQTICGQTTGPPVVPHCGSYFVTLSNIVGLMFYFFFFFTVSNVFFPRPFVQLPLASTQF